MTRRTEPRSIVLALAVVVAWDRLLLAGLPARARAAQGGELAGDIIDHVAWARERGVAGTGVALRLCSRTLRGAGADLAWRRRAQMTLTRHHHGVPHWSSEPVFLVLWTLVAVTVVALLVLTSSGLLPPLAGALASVALLDRWLRRRDAAGYTDAAWQLSRPLPGLRTDFRETGVEQRPPRRS